MIAGIKNAMEKIKVEEPDRIITIGGNCLVSLAPFDYLHRCYDHVGVIWIDAHPDVSTIKDGYPNAHAMVLGSLMGKGAEALSEMMESKKFRPDEIFYIGLQSLHKYQERYLKELGVSYKVQIDKFVSNQEINRFMQRFEHILIHFDIDVLDQHLFHSRYFANKELEGDGAGGGKMTTDQLTAVLKYITENSDVVGFTIAEYLPFDEHRLHKIFSDIRFFTE